jgi:hypothetical protein
VLRHAEFISASVRFLEKRLAKFLNGEALNFTIKTK